MLDTDFQELITIPTAANAEQFLNIVCSGIALCHCNRARRVIKTHNQAMTKSDESLEFNISFKQIAEITPFLDADLLVYFLDNDETALMLAKTDMKESIISLQEIISDAQISGEDVIKFIGELARSSKFRLITFLIENSDLMIQAITNKLPPSIFMDLDIQIENDSVSEPDTDLLNILSQISKTRRCVNASINNKHCLYELFAIFGKDLSSLQAGFIEMSYCGRNRLFGNTGKFRKF